MERAARAAWVVGAAVAVAIVGGGPGRAAPAAKPPPTVALASVGRLGPVLVDARGLTLYRYTRDRPGASACTGSCATAWPPLLKGATLVLGPGLTGRLGAVTRPDRRQQVTYNGIPLYRYAGDRRAGQANGQGAGRVWYVVRKGERLAAAPAATTTTSRPAPVTITAPPGAGTTVEVPDYGY